MMRKLLNRPWFVAVLVLSALVLCTWSVRDARRTGVPRRIAANTVSGEDAATTDEPVDSGMLDAITSSNSIAAVLAVLRFPAVIPDPFARGRATLVAGNPAVPETAPAVPDETETITLTAVWQQGPVRLALVNNRIVQAGDRLGRLTIEEVGIDGILVLHGEGRDFVPFGGTLTLIVPADDQPEGATLAIHDL